MRRRWLSVCRNMVLGVLLTFTSAAVHLQAQPSPDPATLPEPSTPAAAEHEAVPAGRMESERAAPTLPAERPSATAPASNADVTGRGFDTAPASSQREGDPHQPSTSAGTAPSGGAAHSPENLPEQEVAPAGSKESEPPSGGAAHSPENLPGQEVTPAGSKESGRESPTSPRELHSATAPPPPGSSGQGANRDFGAAAASPQRQGGPGDLGGAPPEEREPPAARGPVYNGPAVKSWVPVHSSMSLIHVGSNDSFAITKEGRQAATLLLDSLEQEDHDKAMAEAREASKIYTKIIPRENYGGEYSALQWFADYLVADPDEQGKYLQDPQVKFFYMKFSQDNYALLKEFLLRKYRIRDIGDEDTKAGHERKIWIEDTMLFENPRRESWEKTSKFMKLIKFRPGDKVADLGSGPGYYSFRFAQQVGSRGQIYAIDTDAAHLRWVEDAKVVMGFDNVQTIETDGRTLGIPESAGKLDAVFMCSLYHNIYGEMTPPERDSLIASIRETLKNNGRLYLADNGLVKQGTLPYHGPYIAKELIIGQMQNYGFDLVESYQPIPQRYLLVFKKMPDNDAVVAHKPEGAKKSREAAYKGREASRRRH